MNLKEQNELSELVMTIRNSEHTSTHVWPCLKSAALIQLHLQGRGDGWFTKQEGTALDLRGEDGWFTRGDHTT